MPPARPRLCTSFEKGTAIQPFYSGGSVAITTDGAWIAASFGSEVTIVDAASSQLLKRIPGDGEELNSLAISPNNALLITASRSLALHIYALPHLDLVRTVSRTHDSPIAVMAADPTSSLIATGSADGAVKVWDIKGGYCTHVFHGHGGVISALCWNVRTTTHGRTVELVTGCVDGKMRVWDLQAPSKGAAKPVSVLTGHAGVVRGIAVSTDGQTLVSGARDQTLVYWDRKGDRWQRKEITMAGERIESLGFLTERLFYSAGSLGALRLWDATTAQVVSSQLTEEVPQDADEDDMRGLTDALYAPAQQQLVAVTATQDLAFVEVNTNPPSFSLRRRLVGYNDEIVDMALVRSNDTQQLAVASNNAQIRLFKLDTQDQNVELLDGHRDMVLSVDASGDQQWLASASKDRTARIWTHDGEWRCVAVCEGHAESVGSVVMAHTPAGLPPFMVTASQDRTVKVWDLSSVLATDQEPKKLSSLYTLKIHEKDINAVTIAPNNALLLTGSQDRTARVFQLDYQRATRANKQPNVRLHPLATCRGHKRGVWSVHFSPTEQAFATGSGDQTVRLWSLKDFTCIRVFEGHSASVLRVKFLPLGTQLASAASDGLVKIWNVREEEEATTIDASDDKIWSLAVRAAHENAPLQLLSGAADSTIVSWVDTTEKVQAERATSAQEAVEREQAFSNLLVLKDYKNAIALAFQLNQPRRLFALFTQIAASRPEQDAIESIHRLLANALGTAQDGAPATSITGLAAVDQIVAALPQAQVVQLLGYVRDWNTSARTAPIAQLILHAVVRLHSADTLLNAFAQAKRQEDGKTAPGLGALLEAMVPYTERHYARADRMLVESAMLEYTVQAMDAHLGMGGDLEEEADVAMEL
ncbi:U3 small nucleolar RNA-associated protein 13 [Malassezia vespertilionis]|uniref:U3 small nucleolar RNA-associated protein 13 n=1 Tax=Malassezia vespertilionis TaxID=2020962 RepID=UPI0024B27F99|nr:U3 small nucleolar RNA-associated protein 13 [Malassezia vespertilionis]WFD07219.1 U3 small nucleolar RNA-associated protein 13 [Malassezia vespertilionis]